MISLHIYLHIYKMTEYDADLDFMDYDTPVSPIPALPPVDFDFVIHPIPAIPLDLDNNCVENTTNASLENTSDLIGFVDNLPNDISSNDTNVFLEKNRQNSITTA